MTEQNLCLNIGCGLIVAEGWQNIDASPTLRVTKIPLLGKSFGKVIKAPNWSEKVHYGNIIKGLKISAESCDLIYASHVLEHLTIADFQVAMNHIYCYLKPHGIFRAVVPDLESLIHIYLNQRKDPKLAPKAAFNFMQDSLVGHIGTRKTIFDRSREIFSNYRHQWMWDQPSLMAAFEEQGFKNVQVRDYGEWGDPRFAQVEHPESFRNAICVEGEK